MKTFRLLITIVLVETLFPFCQIYSQNIMTGYALGSMIGNHYPTVGAGLSLEKPLGTNLAFGISGEYQIGLSDDEWKDSLGSPSAIGIEEIPEEETRRHHSIVEGFSRYYLISKEDPWLRPYGQVGMGVQRVRYQPYDAPYWDKDHFGPTVAAGLAMVTKKSCYTIDIRHRGFGENFGTSITFGISSFRLYFNE